VAHDTRARLIAAAAKLLDRGGPAEVKLREVGKLAGVSHNAPYKHFADKEELLAAIAAEELRNQSQMMGHLAGAKPIDSLRAIGQAYVSWARAHPARFWLTLGGWNRESNELRQAADDSRAQLVSIVKAAQADSELPQGDPERLAALMLALVSGAVNQSLAGHLSASGKGNANPEDLLDDLLGHLTQSVVRRRKSKTRARRRRVEA
jgi:AcrR family transcriptional regulator